MSFQGAASQKGECPQISENKQSALVLISSIWSRRWSIKSFSILVNELNVTEETLFI